MKNVRSIIYVCMAAVLILGFTSCQEPQSYKVPSGLTAQVTKTDYIIGEEFDPSTAVATVSYVDGSTRSISGSALEYTLYSSEGTAATDQKVGADSYVVLSYGGATGKAAINASSAESIVLANLPTTATTNGTDDAAFSAEDYLAITGTVTLSNGATREVATADGSLVVTAEINGGTTVTTAKTDVAVEYTATVFSTSVDVTAPEDGYTVNVLMRVMISTRMKSPILSKSRMR